MKLGNALKRNEKNRHPNSGGKDNNAMPKPVTKETRLLSLYETIRAGGIQTVQTAKKFSMGNPHAPLLVVMNHPHVDIMGEEAKYLKQVLHLLKLPPHDVFMTYAIKGYLLKKEGNDWHIESREVRQEEIDEFRPSLLDEIAIVKPKVVLCMGGTAAKTLFGDPHFSVTREAGAELEAPGIDCPVIVTVSHSYAVKTGGERGKAHRQIMADFSRAVALSKSSDFEHMCD